MIGGGEQRDNGEILPSVVSCKESFPAPQVQVGVEEVRSTWEEEAGVIELGGGLSDDDWARVVKVVDKIKKQCRRTI